MVYFRQSETLVKIGVLNDDLRDAVRKYHEELEKGKSVLGVAVQYVVFNPSDNQTPYLLIVSQSKDRSIHHQLGHNCILTVTSYSDSVNKEVATGFERETGISLDLTVPNCFRRAYQSLNSLLYDFENDPDLAMALFTGRRK